MDFSVLIWLALLLVASLVAYVYGRRREEKAHSERLDGLVTARDRGAVAEVELEALLRSRLPSDSFQLQYELVAASGKSVRADAVVHVDGRLLPVDSKYSEKPWIELTSTKPGDAAHSTASSKFRRAVKTMVDDVASKYIRPDQATHAFAVMFIAAEPIYAAAVADERITEHASAKGVVLASPSSFDSLLSLLSLAERAERLEDASSSVAAKLETAQLDLGEIVSTFETLGRHIGNAETKHREIRTRLEELSRLLAGTAALDEATEAAEFDQGAAEGTPLSRDLETLARRSR